MSVNLGTATAYIDLDSSRFNAGIARAGTSLASISRESRKAESEFQSLNGSLTSSGNYFKRLDLQAQSLGNKLKSTQGIAKTYGQAMQDTSKSVKDAEKEHDNLGKKMTTLQGHLQRANQMYGENSKQSQMYAKAINNIEKQQAGLEREIEQGNVAIEEFGIAMKNAETQATGLQRELKNFKLKQIGQDMTQLGGMLTAGITLPLAGVAAASVKTAATFEAGMSEVKAITGATGNDLKKLENQAKDLGASTKFSATEAAEGMKYFGMAGYKTNDIMSALPATLDLAAAGGTDLGLACDIVSDAMTGLGMAANETGKFADIMAATITNANTSIELMGECFAHLKAS